MTTTEDGRYSDALQDGRHDDALEIETLTAREIEILGLIAGGQTNREIAQNLFLSEETIKWYNKRAYQKLGVGNRVQAVIEARRHGILQGNGAQQQKTPSSLRHNLPAELSSFVGRSAELTDVRQLLEKVRLVTLTGPGGTGKTRLALHLAHSLVAEEGRHVVYVSLASVLDANVVPETIADALGIRITGKDEAQEAIQRYLREKEMLIILDNCEHLPAATPLVAEMLTSAPGLTILATSREALRLSGEREYAVPPLTVPVLAVNKSVEELVAFESVSLFVQRAYAVNSDFCLTAHNAAAVAAICARVDGLPLAIELAAARIRLFTPKDLLRHLQQRFHVLGRGARDLPPRQRTLWDTIEWSYNLLDEDERRLFRRLAVFSGGFSLESAQAVCGPGLDGDVMDGVDSLLAKSLLYRGDGSDQTARFHMLATVHEFARERLAASGERELMQASHLDYYVSLAETMAPGFRYHGQLRLLRRVDADFSNFRAAFVWAMAQERIEAAARLMAGLEYYLLYSQETGEGYRWVMQLINRRGEIREQWRARVLFVAGRIACHTGDHTQLGRQLCREGLALARLRSDREMEAWLLLEMAILSGSNEEGYTDAITIAKEGLALAHELQDEAAIAQGFNMLGELYRLVGDDEQARRAYEQSLATCRETGEQFREAMMLTNLSFVAYNAGEFEKAKQLAEVHLRDMLAMPMKKPCDILGLAVLAGALGRLGEPQKAARLLGASESLREEMGAAFRRQDQRQLDRYVTDARARLDEDTFDAAWREGQTMSLEQAVAYATGAPQTEA